jgi:hypothetical protein
MAERKAMPQTFKASEVELSGAWTYPAFVDRSSLGCDGRAAARGSLLPDRVTDG